MRCLPALLMVIWLGACSNPTERTIDEAFYAPDFTLVALDGTPYTLSDLQGDWIILNFWATWCGPCVEEMPVLQAISQNYASTLTLLGINQGESADKVQAFQADHSLSFPLLLNPDHQTLMAYQVISLPQTIVIAPNGEIVWRQFGPLDLDTFAATLDKLIAG